MLNTLIEGAEIDEGAHVWDAERRFKHSLGRPEQRIETRSVKGRRGKSKSYLSWENRVSEGRMREACCRGGSCVKVLEFRLSPA